jgi:hypothetical protein
MITGFNTDVEHGGTVYHVQTEDKGLDSPLILSLVYVGGAILASKRSPYDDLIAKGFDERELADRLNRQHKLICAAIRAGRIDDLKRMSQREGSQAAKAGQVAAQPAPPKPSPQSSKAADAPAKKGAAKPAQAQPEVFRQPEAATQTRTASRSEAAPEPAAPATSSPEPKVKKAAQQKGVRSTMRAILQDVVADFARADAAAEGALHLSLLEEKEFRGGANITLNIRVGAGADGQEAISGADITVKVLGSTFRPLIFPTKTGPDGIATVRAMLPHFQTGRAALLIRAIANGYEAELRRIIHQG